MRKSIERSAGTVPVARCLASAFVLLLALSTGPAQRLIPVAVAESADIHDFLAAARQAAPSR